MAELPDISSTITSSSPQVIRATNPQAITMSCQLLIEISGIANVRIFLTYHLFAFCVGVLALIIATPARHARLAKQQKTNTRLHGVDLLKNSMTETAAVVLVVSVMVYLLYCILTGRTFDAPEIHVL
jgi:hypothetical protein